MCKINNKPTPYLLDTGSNKTIININSIDIFDNQYGNLEKFNNQVYTADGNTISIIGQKKCKLQFDKWECIIDVLIPIW